MLLPFVYLYIISSASRHVFGLVSYTQQSTNGTKNEIPTDIVTKLKPTGELTSWIGSSVSIVHIQAPYIFPVKDSIIQYCSFVSLLLFSVSIPSALRLLYRFI